MIQSLSFLFFCFLLVVGYFLYFFSFFHLTNFNCGSVAEEREQRSEVCESRSGAISVW